MFKKYRTPIIIGLIIFSIIVVAFIIQTLLAKPTLPPTEKDYQKAGKDVEEVKKKMLAPTSEADIKFTNIEALKLSNNEELSVKSVLFQVFPESLIIEFITESLTIKETSYPEYKMTQRIINVDIKVSEKTYRMNIIADGKIPFIRIYEGEKQIYITPYS